MNMRLLSFASLAVVSGACLVVGCGVDDPNTGAGGGSGGSHAAGTGGKGGSGGEAGADSSNGGAETGGADGSGGSTGGAKSEGGTSGGSIGGASGGSAGGNGGTGGTSNSGGNGGLTGGGGFIGTTSSIPINQFSPVTPTCTPTSGTGGSSAGGASGVGGSGGAGTAGTAGTAGAGGTSTGTAGAGGSSGAAAGGTAGSGTVDTACYRYDSGAQTVTIIAREYIQFPLPRTMAPGQTVVVHVTGSNQGTTGFRSWLVDNSQTTSTNVQFFTGTNSSTIPIGNFTLDYSLTVLDGLNPSYLFFKAPSFGGIIENVTFTSITVTL